MTGWITKMSARLDEMSQGRQSLRIEVHRDGDIVLCIDHDGTPIENDRGAKSQVEFCNTSGGGGVSPNTRRALVALLEAMKKDAKHDPSGIPKYPVHLAEYMK